MERETTRAHETGEHRETVLELDHLRRNAERASPLGAPLTRFAAIEGLKELENHVAMMPADLRKVPIPHWRPALVGRRAQTSWGDRPGSWEGSPLVLEAHLRHRIIGEVLQLLIQLVLRHPTSLPHDAASPRHSCPRARCYSPARLRSPGRPRPGSTFSAA